MEIAEPITDLIQLVRAGNQNARRRLWNAVFPVLEKKAKAVLAGNNVAGVMRPSDLLQDAFLQLMRHEKIGWNDRKHLFAFAAEVMKHIVIDRARKHLQNNRCPAPLDEIEGIEFNDSGRWLEIDLALQKLAQRDPLKARLVELRIFGGLTIEETAEVLGIAPATVKRHWKVARAFLMSRLQ